MEHAHAVDGLGSRERQIERLRHETFDVAIVGGGISGAGIALDLSARGLRVALVERGDFAGATSSRSSKLVHGGLRYLAQYQFGVTRESLHERELLQRLAPALVEPMPFVIPIFDGLIEAARVALGLALYDVMSGDRAHPFAMMRRVDLRRLAPGIDTSRLTTAYSYRDCRTDDARLTLAVLAQAAERGAALANHAAVDGLIHERGQARGLRFTDRRDGTGGEIRARCIVLATGPWGDRELSANGAESAARVRPSKGVHLFFSRRRLDTQVALYLPTGVDNRLIFVVPWHGHTLVGTTDTDYTGPLDSPRVERSDVDYLLGVLNRAFPDHRFADDDIVGAQAGLRPLVQSDGPSTRASREDHIWTRHDGAVVVGGGKLTTYRHMAERVAQHIRPLVGGAPGAPTASIELAPLVDIGAARGRLARLGVGAGAIDHLGRVYGRRADAIATLVEEDPALAEPIVPGQLPIRAEVVFAARHEQARAIGDVLARRTRLLLLDQRASLAAAPDVAKLMEQALGWKAGDQKRALTDFAIEQRQYGLPAWQETIDTPKPAKPKRTARRARI